MNTVSIKLLLCTIVLMYTVNQSSAQRPPDSLIRKVVIFKRPAYGNAVDSAVKQFYKEAKLPQATGFYVRPDSIGQLYLATAKHVFLRKDTIQTIMIEWKTNLEKYSFWSSHLYRVDNVGLYHQDTLIDIVLASQSLPPQVINNVYNEVQGFSPNEIMAKEEFLSVKPNQELFFIGMYPDSISSIEDCYWFPTGRLKEIYTTPRKAVDTIKNITITYDFTLDIIGKAGISGSPVFMKVGTKYKIFGIINGLKSNSSQEKRSQVFHCTAAYRILEILHDNSLL